MGRKRCIINKFKGLSREAAAGPLERPKTLGRTAEGKVGLHQNLVAGGEVDPVAADVWLRTGMGSDGAGEQCHQAQQQG